MHSPIHNKGNTYFRHIFEDNPDSYFLLGLDKIMPLDLSWKSQLKWINNYTKTESVNREFVDLCQLNEDSDVLGLSLTQLLKDCFSIALEAVKKLIQDKLHWENEKIETTTASGEIKYYSVTIQPIIEDSYIVAFWGKVADITDDELLKISFAKEKDITANILDSLPMPVTLTSMDGNIGYMNAKFTEVLGYTSDDIKNAHDWFEKVYPDEEYRQKAIASATETNQNPEDYVPEVWEVTCKNGEVRSIKFYYTAFGEHWLTILDDVTVIKQHEEEVVRQNKQLTVVNEELRATTTEYEALNEELHALNQELNTQNVEFQHLNEQLSQQTSKYKLLTDNIRDVITTHDHNWDFQYVAASCLSVTGYTPKELKQHTIVKYIHPKDLGKLRRVAHYISMGIPSKANFRFRCKDGKYKWLEMLSKPIRDKKGKIIQILNSTRDISEQKEIENKLHLTLERQLKAEEIGKLGVWDWDISKNETWWSANHYKIFGEIPFSFQPTIDYFLGYIERDGKNNIRHAIEHALVHESSFSQTFKVRLKSGEEKVLFGQAVIHRDKEGAPVRWIGANIDITEFYESKKALKYTKQKHDGLFNSLLDTYYEANLDGVIDTVTPSIYNLLGYTPSEIIGKKSVSLYKNPNRRTELLDILKEHGEVKRFGGILIKKDKSHCFCEAHITWRYDSQGNINGTKGTIKDVSELKHIEQKIIDRELLLSSLFDSMEEGLILYNTKGEVEEYNQAALKILSVDDDLLHQQKFVYSQKTIHEDYSVFYEHQSALYRTLKSGETTLNVIMGVQSENEKVIWVNSNATPIKNQETGAIEKIIVTLSDITQIKKNQERLEELALVAESTLNTVVITDERKRVQWVNSSFVESTGYKLNEVKGKIAGRFLQGKNTDKAVVKYINERLEEGLPAHADLINYRKNGEEFWVTLDIHPIRDNKGKVIKYVSVQTDISDRKKYEKELIEKNKELTKSNFELDNFVYRVSHDIRSPLSSALGLLNLMRVEQLVEEDKNPYIGMLEDTLNTQDKILRDILDYSINAREEVNYEEVNLKELSTHLFKSLEYMDMAEGKIKLLLEFEEDTIFIIDRSRLEFIIRNIMSNAIKYRDRKKDYHYIKMFLAEDEHYHYLKIEDNGIGIRKNDLAEVFGMFYRGEINTKGSGLGLYIVREAVEKMGGKISVTSRRYIYTCFTIALPKFQIKQGRYYQTISKKIAGIETI